MSYLAAAAYVAALLSAAAGAYGTASANKARNIETEERHKALKADRERQAKLQEESDARLRQEVGKFAPDDVQGEIDLAAAARAAAATPQAAPAPSQYQAAPASAPVEVTSDAKRRLEGAGMKAREEAAKRARLAAYGDVSQQQNFGMNRLGENLRRLRGESAGSTNIMGIESRLPSTGAEGYRNRADAANIIGQIGTLYSMGAGARNRTPKPDSSAYAGWSESPY